MKRLICVLLAFTLFCSVTVFAADAQINVQNESGTTKISVSGIAAVSGQEVTVQLLKPGVTEAKSGADILFQKQVTADTQGKFAFEILVPENLPSGTIQGSLFYEDGKKYPFSVEYKSNSEVQQGFEMLKQETDAWNARTLIEQFSEEWAFDLSLYEALNDDGKNVAVSYYLTFRNGNEAMEQSAECMKKAVTAAALNCYSGDFSDLLDGKFADYTKLNQNATYKMFANRLNKVRLAERMKKQNFGSVPDMDEKFSIEIALLMIENASGWFDVKEAADVLIPLLGLDGKAFSEAPEKLGTPFAGNVYTAESFKDAFNTEMQKAESGVRVVFTDVAELTLWANDSINALYDAGIVSGTSATTFDPNGNVTREQFAKMLVSMLGDMEFVSGSSFSDVPTSEWFAPYVATAKEIGLVNGVSATEFGVGQNITREQMAAMIYRAGNLLGYKANGTPKTFTDATNISDYAKPAVDALTAGGVINGMSDGSFAPSATATRAEAACMIYNMIKATAHTPDMQTGLKILEGNNPMVDYAENFDRLTEKDYKERDLASLAGWFFVPSGNSYISVVQAPSGKQEILPSDENKDMAIRISANSSTASAFFDTEPFFLSEDTYGNMRMEMNLNLSTDNLSEKNIVFNMMLMSYVSANLSKELPFMYFAGNGGVYYYTENGSSVRCGSYPQNKWFRFATDMDTVNETFDLYIDGVRIAENVPFSNQDVYWDGTDPNAELKKIRLRVGVRPSGTTNSQAFMDDFLWAMYTDAPAVVPDKEESKNNQVVLSVPENVDKDTLKHITLSVNGNAVNATGVLSGEKYILTLPALNNGDVVEITVGKWVATENGVLTGTPRKLIYTVQ